MAITPRRFAKRPEKAAAQAQTITITWFFYF
jgi:hypothetical protein